jgi:transcriptional regulator with XRE-family HTH domain
MASGHYLRRQREERDMTLTELARRVEISIAYLSRIERQLENPPPDHLISALAGALSLPRDDLFVASRRLPPDLRAHRPCDRGLPAASRWAVPMTLQFAYPFDRRSREPRPLKAREIWSVAEQVRRQFPSRRPIYCLDLERLIRAIRKMSVNGMEISIAASGTERGVRRSV